MTLKIEMIKLQNKFDNLENKQVILERCVNQIEMEHKNTIKELIANFLDYIKTKPVL